MNFVPLPILAQAWHHFFPFLGMSFLGSGPWLLHEDGVDGGVMVGMLFFFSMACCRARMLITDILFWFLQAVCAFCPFYLWRTKSWLFRSVVDFFSHHPLRLFGKNLPKNETVVSLPQKFVGWGGVHDLSSQRLYNSVGSSFFFFKACHVRTLHFSFSFT